VNLLWAVVGLAALIAAVLRAARVPRLQRLFRWLPIPLWCYLLPIVMVEIGGLPPHDPSAPLYRPLTMTLLPVALGLLLLGVNLRHILRTGSRALAAAAIGACGIGLGAVSGVWVCRPLLPTDAWQGAGALAGTWTGGTMNLLALRAALSIPDAVFAPLILVDALIAYGWMALLVALSGSQPSLNRWLGATTNAGAEDDLAAAPAATLSWSSVTASVFMAVCVAMIAGRLAAWLPTTSIITSRMGWTVVLVTTIALGCSLLPRVRRIGAPGDRLGYPLLYLVLAATGAQTRLDALQGAYIWILVGLWTVLVHGGILLCSGRLLRIPIGLLATASQANLGGLVSGPLVGAIYHRRLAPVGLLLAVAGNAFGTYLGLACAAAARWLLSAT